MEYAVVQSDELLPEYFCLTKAEWNMQRRMRYCIFLQEFLKLHPIEWIAFEKVVLWTIPLVKATHCFQKPILLYHFKVSLRIILAYVLILFPDTPATRELIPSHLIQIVLLLAVL